MVRRYNNNHTTILKYGETSQTVESENKSKNMLKYILTTNIQSSYNDLLVLYVSLITNVYTITNTKTDY